MRKAMAPITRHNNTGQSIKHCHDSCRLLARNIRNIHGKGDAARHRIMATKSAIFSFFDFLGVFFSSSISR